MANYDVESHIKKLFFYFFLSPYARTTRYEEAFLPEGKKMASVASLPRLCLIKITTERQTTESDIPPSYRATKRYTKIHLGFCLRFSTLIGQIGRVQLSGAGPKRSSGRGYSGWPSPLSGVPLPLPGGKTASESRDLTSGHYHDRTAFESFAPDISEQPDPNLSLIHI